MELIHYGKNPFDIGLFEKVENGSRNKPAGGFWTSPINSKFGWKDWCESANYGDLSCSHAITYPSTCKILRINNEHDLDYLPWLNSYKIDFEILVREGFDAMHLTVEGESATRHTFPRSLYGWDCETVLIFNSELINAA